MRRSLVLLSGLLLAGPVAAQPHALQGHAKIAPIPGSCPCGAKPLIPPPPHAPSVPSGGHAHHTDDVLHPIPGACPCQPLQGFPPVEGGCATHLPACKATYRLHFVEEQCTQAQLATKEVIKPCTRTLLEFDEKTEKRLRTELVLKPRYITKEVCEQTVEAKMVTDPCTGCKKLVFTPVTKTKQVQVVVYDVCPEQKEVEIKTLCVKPKTEQINITRLELEVKPQDYTRTTAVLLPTYTTEKTIAVSPPCPPDTDSKKPATPPK